MRKSACGQRALAHVGQSGSVALLLRVARPRRRSARLIRKGLGVVAGIAGGCGRRGRRCPRWLYRAL
eukprot:8103835-Alexandrium_andersonii.AAC.1